MTKEELDLLKKTVIQRQNDNQTQTLKNSYEWQNNRERLIVRSLRGKNVLVIGSEAILNKSFPSDFNDSTILNKAKGDTEQLIFEYLKNNKLYAGYNSLTDAQEIPSLFRDINKILKDKDNEWRNCALEMLDPSLRLLLESKCFRLVITTAFDPILEYALLKIWGDELKIKNIHDADMSNTDILTEINRKSEFYDINPTLYYAFGKAIAGTNSMYALIDDRKIYTIDCWLASRKPEKLLQYILYKDIMAIGCKFENWVFRFFWYLLGQKPSGFPSHAFETTCKEGSVAIMLSDENNEEEKIKSFIDKKDNIDYFEDSRAFMSLLAPELVPEIPPQIGEFFISYASENFSTANIIYNLLIENKQKVWFDIRLKAGDRFNEEINKGIEQCSVFLPILSNQTKKDLLQKKERYYQREWELANEKFIKNRNFLVIPIVIEEYSVTDAEYHNVESVTDCIKNATCFPINEHVSLNQLLNEDNEQKYKLIKNQGSNSSL